MINDNIVINVVEVRNGQCKLAIEADRDVKIYREEIYYQIKLANLVGKNTNINAVESASNLLKKDGIELNDSITSDDTSDIEISSDKTAKKNIVIKKNNVE